MRNTHLQPSRRTIQTTIQWPANRRLHGSVDIRRFYVPCRRFTFTFDYIKRRNQYIEYCYVNNRRALLPKIQALYSFIAVHTIIFITVHIMALLFLSLYTLWHNTLLLLYTLWHYYNTLFITVHIMALYSQFITVLLPMRKWVK